ncbi:MAG: hypothetical protein NW241_23625 [Bacteroidia bacterium]|nr:hypothetical protein [Bacteroidia bacterium]
MIRATTFPDRRLAVLLLACLLPLGLAAQRADKRPKPSGAVVYDLALSPDSSWLAFIEGFGVHILPLDSGGLPLHWSTQGEHRSIPLAIAYAADGSAIATAGRDSSILIWDLASQTVRRRLQLHRGIVITLAWSPDGQYLASGGTDGRVLISDAASGELHLDGRAHGSDVTAVAFHPDSYLMASCAADGSIAIWDVASATRLSLIQTGKLQQKLQFAQDGSHLYTVGGQGRVGQWNVRQPERPVEGGGVGTGPGWNIALSYDRRSQMLAIGGIGRSVRISSPQLKYSYAARVPVFDLALLFDETHHRFRLAMATCGRGLLLVDGEDLKVR